MNAAPNILRFRDVTVRYGRQPALQDVTLDIPCGSLTAILGPNGAGKSTLPARLPRLAAPDPRGDPDRRRPSPARPAPPGVPSRSATRSTGIFRSPCAASWSRAVIRPCVPGSDSATATARWSERRAGRARPHRLCPTARSAGCPAASSSASSSRAPSPRARTSSSSTSRSPASTCSRSRNWRTSSGPGRPRAARCWRRSTTSTRAPGLRPRRPAGHLARRRGPHGDGPGRGQHRPRLPAAAAARGRIRCGRPHGRFPG